MAKEVEVIARVLDSKDATLQTLHTCKSRGTFHTFGIYLYDPLRDNLKPTSSLRLRESFRIRKQENHSKITYKIDHFEKDNETWTYSDEYEVGGVIDFDMLVALFEKLGFRRLVEIENERHVFQDGKYEIIFEDVKNLGLFLEVEYKDDVPHDKVESIKQEIREYMHALGINLKEELFAGKPELMLRKLHAL